MRPDYNYVGLAQSGDGPDQAHEPRIWERAVSRGGLIRTTAGIGGAILGANLQLPNLAEAASASSAASAPNMPRPIPKGGIPGAPFRVFPFAADKEPSTITDFNGVIGVTDVQNNATNMSTNERLLVDTDMRFMVGTYIGMDGRVHQGTFGFVWIDLYRGRYDFDKFSTQIADLDLGIHPFPSGLFWTVALPPENVQVDLATGSATYRVSNLPIRNYGSIPNAFSGPHAKYTTGTVSFSIEWKGMGERSQFRDPKLQFTAGVILNSATMEFTAVVGGVTYKSDPAHMSHSTFAQIGHERNGIFYSEGD